MSPDGGQSQNMLSSFGGVFLWAPGVAGFSWLTDAGYELHFFGLTNAPGTSVTIVPEPGTAALLALGLAGLAWRSRRE